MKKYLSLITVLVLITVKQGFAQIDPHFSQYYVYPTYINPALTGIFDGDYRISGIYRNQWSSVNSPFTTPGISVDVQGNKTLNYGVNIMNQSAGAFNTTNAGVSAAYTGLRLGVNGNQRIVFGLNMGMINRRLNTSKATYGDQYNPGGANPLPTSEVFNVTNATAFDASMGVFYYDAEPGKKANIYGGFSFAHLTQPSQKFLTNSAEQDKVPMRFSTHGGVRILFDSWSFTPNFLYMRQAKAEEIMLGGYAQIRANETTDVLGGINYRFNDAIVAFTGVYFKNMVLGLSYDINTSDLGRMAKGASSFEISLTYIGRKKASTPSEGFICPRL